MKIRFYAFIGFFMSFGPVWSQDYLSAQDAIRVALENNFSVQAARNEKQISENNFSRGNAGFLPRLDLAASYSRSISNQNSQFLDGREQNVNGAQSNRRQAGLGLTWTLFDGLGMFKRYRQFGIINEQTELNLKIQMQTTISSVLRTYYAIVQNQKSYKVLLENIEYSRERYRIAQDRYELGAISRLDFLRAQVDLNNDSLLLIEQKQSVAENKATLNQLLNQDANTDFKVDTSLTLLPLLEYDALKDGLETQNFEILAQRKARENAQLQIDIDKANRLPTLDFTADYNYLKSVSDAGFLISNRNYGLTYGFNFSFPLFDGFNRRRDLQNSRVRLLSEEQRSRGLKNEIDADYAIAYSNYLQNRERLDFQRYTTSVSKENLDIAIETFKLGGLSAIDFRDIQRTYLISLVDLLDLEYQIKLDEIALLEIAGELIRPYNP